MWIVLLDHSGSMGEPFAATAQQIKSVGRVRSVEAEIKWEAAKKSFLLELRRLPEDMEVMLFGFMEQTHLIFSGHASQADEFERHLNAVSPDDGTDIAAALNNVHQYAGKRPQVLLITDGISDLESAKTEARQCANTGIRVDVLVIDPTDKGVEMARAIAGITQGRWDPVTSAAELEKLTSESAAAHAAVLARTQEILQEAQAEFEEISKSVADKTKVSFSAGYPSRIGIHQKYPLVVYIHLEQLKDKIDDFLKKEIASTGVTPSCSTAAASTRIPPGTLITFKPNIPDIFANPPQQEVVWVEDYHKVSFKIRYIGNKEDGTTCSGFVDVFANGMLIGNIPVSLAVNSKSDSVGELNPVLSLGSSFNRIFASYARKDIVIVHACKEAYNMLGIHLFIDRDDLLSGQDWNLVIQNTIRGYDLFQLYWSQAAADSKNVESEWRLALQVSPNRNNNFIRPLYWQVPNPPIPKELGHINFAYLDTRQLQIVEDTAVDTGAKMAGKMEMDAIFPVISLTGKDTSDSMKVLQKSIGQAVSFLEDLTGLRYYPPTTLLVDDYIVKAVRSHLVVDQNQPSPDKNENDKIEPVLDILQALALEFHVHNLEPDGKERYKEEWQKNFYNLKTDIDYGGYYHVRTTSESIFAHPVKKYIEGEDPFKQPGGFEKFFSEYQTTLKASGSYPEYLDKWFDFWIRYLKIVADKNNVSINMGFGIDEKSSSWLRSRFPETSFQTTPKWVISTVEIVKVVERLKPILMSAVKNAGDNKKIQEYFISAASTYGIFASAEVGTVTQYLLKITREQNWPAGLALEGSHKVLLCANAFERYKSELLTLGADKQKVDEMAAWFLAATLVHEHFHGIAATGIDRHGKSSWAAKDWNEWDKGNLLNESLAAWAERHFFRNNAAMFENVTEYIQSGQYPDWPYRGAEKIEKIYMEQGLKGVRALINQLREDPQIAQETFNGIQKRSRKRHAPPIRY
jgi:hypothetical protein